MSLAVPSPNLPAMSAAAIEKIRRLQCAAGALPPATLETQHIIHAGLYARTILIPANATEKGLIAGALIKIATIVIIQGDVVVWLGEESRRITGYAVLPGSAGRKQAFLAIEPTFVTMLFATKALTVEEAEREFTDESADLVSRRPGADNKIIITDE